MLWEYGPQKNMSADRLTKIARANAIIEEVQAQGYTLTLRQLYYQHVARGLIENSVNSYKNLGDIVADGRLHGMISWEAIEDRGRGVEKIGTNEDVQHALHNIEWGVVVDLWARQDVYVEVWVEKDALSEVVEKACKPWRVPYMACKGYLSLSEGYAAGRRYRDAIDSGKQELVLIHLGDHDPSGIDMTRENGQKLTMFSECEDDGLQIDVVRLALNMDQVQQYSPPPNPAKETDSRHAGYKRIHGDQSWELDALHPRVIHEMIDREIRKYVDMRGWRAALALEEQKHSQLIRLRQNWPAVAKFIDEQFPT